MRAFAWVGSRTLHRLDAPFQGRERSLSSFATSLPLCYLTVAARRSGEPRAVRCSTLLTDGDRVVLIASNWGGKRHPSWALNLDAAEHATVTVGRVERELAARRATLEEFERYWPEAVRLWPGYEGYRRRAGREIRMYVLEPARGGTPEGVG